jgi:hypothetical protein
MSASRIELLASASVARSNLDATAQRTASRYADPAAWLVVDAVAAALRERCCPAARRIREAGDGVGVVAASEFVTAHTMRALNSRLPSGQVSPLRFAGANPGMMAGLVCVQFGFRGPSLVLAMPVAAARPVTAVLARAWITAGACRYVVIAEHQLAAGGWHRVACRIVGTPD